MVQSGARECVLAAAPADDPDASKVQQIIDRAGLALTVRPAADFAAEYEHSQAPALTTGLTRGSS